jgi:hypothetical protein
MIRLARDQQLQVSSENCCRMSLLLWHSFFFLELFRFGGRDGSSPRSLTRKGFSWTTTRLRMVRTFYSMMAQNSWIPS